MVKPKRYAGLNDKMVERQQLQDDIFDAWWKQWMVEVFDTLMPYRRWKKAYPNLAVGDVCLIMSDNQLGGADYRICKVSEVFPDSQGVVRTVAIVSRPRDAREKSLPYVHKDLKTQKVSVQRLVLILPVSQQAELSQTKVDPGKSVPSQWAILSDTVNAIRVVFQPICNKIAFNANFSD